MQGGPLRKLVLLALVLGVVAAVVKALRGEPAPQFATHPSVTGGPRPAPTPTAAVEAAKDPEPAAPSPTPTPSNGGVTWVEPLDGACPDGYPVKAKLSSGIFHVPGGLAYERTKPDRCYPDPAAAVADGLRASNEDRSAGIGEQTEVIVWRTAACSVSVFFKDIVEKYADVIKAEGVDFKNGFGDLVAGGEDGVQGRHRLLEDHRDLVAANVAQLFGAKR